MEGPRLYYGDYGFGAVARGALDVSTLEFSEHRSEKLPGWEEMA